MSVSLIVVLAACGESSIEPVNEEENQGNSAEAAETETKNENDSNDMEQDNNENETVESSEDADGTEDEVVEKEDLGVGTTVDFNGLHVTLNSAKKYEGDGDWEVPDRDYFVILDISIENKTDEEANVSTMLQMDLVDPNGYAQDMDFMADTKGSLDGEVGAGRTMAGEISFDVEDADYFEFIFEDPFKSGQAIWMIDASELVE